MTPSSDLLQAYAVMEQTLTSELQQAGQTPEAPSRVALVVQDLLEAAQRRHELEGSDDLSGEQPMIEELQRWEAGLADESLVATSFASHVRDDVREQLERWLHRDADTPADSASQSSRA